MARAAPTDVRRPPRPRGVLAAALTPFDEHGLPNAAALGRHCLDLLARGCDAVLVLGTTGEAQSIGVGERLALLEQLGTIAPLRGRLLVGSGCCAISDGVLLTERALAIGAAGVLVLPPFYYKGVSDEGLFRGYAELIERVAAVELRLYLYHFPKMTTLPLSLSLIERLCASYPQTIAGIKNSSGLWDETSEMIARFPGLDVFAGTEALLLPALRAGGAGAISATANLLAEPTARLLGSWTEPGADALQLQLAGWRAIIARYPMIPALKALLARRGDADWRSLRPPLCALNDTIVDALCAELAAAGYSESKN